MDAPSSAKMRVMPTLRPTRPRLMVILLIAGCDWPVDVKQQMGNRRRPPPKGADYIREPVLLQLDLDVDTCRQIQFHQCINSLVSRINNIHQTQMGTNLQLITGSLV